MKIVKESKDHLKSDDINQQNETKLFLETL